MAVFFLPLLSESLAGTTMYTVEYSINGAIQYLSRFSVDAIIFAVILVFAIIFEKVCLL